MPGKVIFFFFDKRMDINIIVLSELNEYVGLLNMHIRSSIGKSNPKSAQRRSMEISDASEKVIRHL